MEKPENEQMNYGGMEFTTAKEEMQDAREQGRRKRRETGFKRGGGTTGVREGEKVREQGEERQQWQHCIITTATTAERRGCLPICRFLTQAFLHSCSSCKLDRMHMN